MYVIWPAYSKCQLISSLIWAEKIKENPCLLISISHGRGTQRAFWGLPQEFSSTKVLEIFSCQASPNFIQFSHWWVDGFKGLRGFSSDSRGFKATRNNLNMMSLWDWSAKALGFHCVFFRTEGCLRKNCSQTPCNDMSFPDIHSTSIWPLAGQQSCVIETETASLDSCIMCHMKQDQNDYYWLKVNSIWLFRFAPPVSTCGLVLAHCLWPLRHVSQVPKFQQSGSPRCMDNPQYLPSGCK